MKKKTIYGLLFIVFIILLLNTKSYGAYDKEGNFIKGFYFETKWGAIFNKETNQNEIEKQGMLVYLTEEDNSSGILTCDLVQELDDKTQLTNFNFTVWDSEVKLREIGKYAFSGCTSLKKISIPADVLKIDDGAFNDCTSLEELELPWTLTSIEKWAFDNCNKLKSINIPKNLEYVRDSAFRDCRKLEKLEFPDTVKVIGDGAFERCTSLKQVVYRGNGNVGLDVDWAGSVFAGAINVVVMCYDNTPMAKHCEKFNVKYNPIDTTYGTITHENVKLEMQDGTVFIRRIPNKYETFDMQEFLNEHVKNVNYSKVRICDSAFVGNDKLKKIKFPNNLEIECRGYAFAGCTSLKEFEYPTNSNYWLPFGTFLGCTSLKKVTIKGSFNGIVPTTFIDCGAIELTASYDALKNMGTIEEINKMTNIEKITILDGLEVLGDDARLGFFPNLKTVVLPNSIKKIGSSCFNARRVNFHGDVEPGCGLENINLPESVTEIGYGAFENCYKLKHLQLPKNLTKIEGYAFSGCTSLESLNIPEKVTEIGKFAFFRCDSIKNITINGEIEEWGTESNYEWYVTPATVEIHFAKDQSYYVSNAIGKWLHNIKNPTVYIKNESCYNLIGLCERENIKYIIETKPGDIDGDDEITAFDAYTALEKSLNPEILTEQEKSVLDIDKDGDITAFDAYLILAYSVGIVDETYWN